MQEKGRKEEVIEHLMNLNDLDRVLSKMNDKDINNLYLRVFSSADGELVLQDMANRFHVSIPPVNQFEDGQYSAYVSIITRLRNAVETKEE